MRNTRNSEDREYSLSSLLSPLSSFASSLLSKLCIVHYALCIEKGLCIVHCALCIILVGCKSRQTAVEVVAQSPAGPAFVADSAFAYCEAQCQFGPRTMNSEAHEKCAQWIIGKFEQFGCEVTTQEATLKGYDGTSLKSKNIIASYRPKKEGGADANEPVVLLCAHWDSRPWADNDPDSTNWRKPVLAANDGASGVAVMLEIARLLQQCDSLHVGVDFVCFDAEDWGTPQWDTTTQVAGDPWALGAQYWAAQQQSASAPTYAYGILLDMVGGQGAHFAQEGMSKKHAQMFFLLI